MTILELVGAMSVTPSLRTCAGLAVFFLLSPLHPPSPRSPRRTIRSPLHLALRTPGLSFPSLGAFHTNNLNQLTLFVSPAPGISISQTASTHLLCACTCVCVCVSPRLMRSSFFF